MTEAQFDAWLWEQHLRRSPRTAVLDTTQTGGTFTWDGARLGQRPPDRAELPSITCPVCDMTSFHPMDRQEGWCGHCHGYTHHWWWYAQAGRTIPAGVAVPPDVAHFLGTSQALEGP